MTKINQEEYHLLKYLSDKWEWIARDSKGDDGGDLFAYLMKPIKNRDTGGWLYGRGGFRSISNDLFQFIQWEDLEPYNVAELIEEYESEEAEVKSKQELIEKWESAIESAEFYGKGKEEELIGYMKDFVSDLKQLDEPETNLDRAFEKVAKSYPMTKEEIWRHLERLVAYGGKVTYGELDEPEVLSQEWIDKHVETTFDLDEDFETEFIKVDDLQNIIVPNQEEVDRAYKDGYEKGKQHTFYKGYLEGITDKGSEPETVADVVTAFWKSYERLKEVMSMEVKELE